MGEVSLVALAEQAKVFKENVEKRREERDFHKGQISLIDDALRTTTRVLSQIGRGRQPEPVYTTPSTAKNVAKPSTERVKTLALAIFKKDGELEEGELAVKLTNAGIGQLPPDQMIPFVYNECIQPLIRDGKLVAVGERPNRKYKLK